MSLDAIDRESEAVRTGFRITLADLEATIAEVEYIVRDHLTVAVIRLRNGYFLVGKSAPVDPGNYNDEYGEKLAYEDALRQAWPLLAFAHLEASAAHEPRRVADLDALTAASAGPADPSGVLVRLSSGLFEASRVHPEGHHWRRHDDQSLTVHDAGGRMIAEYPHRQWVTVEHSFPEDPE